MFERRATIASALVCCALFATACSASVEWTPFAEAGIGSAHDAASAPAPSSDAQSPDGAGAREPAPGARDAGQGGRPAIDARVGNADVVDAQSGAAANDAATQDAASSGAPAEAGAVVPAGSCFGRCGAPVLLALAGSCTCDVACHQRGDCCPDKHELCAASDATALCPLTGRDGDPAACGSDLGWSFVHEGQIEIFFGDSYDAACAVPLVYDDAQGRLPLVRPAALPVRPPERPIACGRLLALDQQSGRASFAPMRLYEGGAALSSWLLETPLTGFSDGSHAYTLSRRGNQLDAPIYLAVRDPSAAPNVTPGRSVYRVLNKYVTRHFQNPTASAVVRFDADAPEQSDYREGTHTLFMFGRDDFSGANARRLYLARQALPLLDERGMSRWSPLYFAGMDGDKPRWSADEAAALPIIGEDFSMTMQSEVAWVAELDRWIMLYGGDVADSISDEPSDQPRHGAIHMRMAKQPWGPWTRPTPLLFREHAAPFLRCDAPPLPAPGLPAGCDLDDVLEDPLRSYNTGDWGPAWRDFEGCRKDAPEPRSPAFTPGSILPCPGGVQRGNLYAPNLIVPWTVDRKGEHGYAHAATLYFNVSTWSPYQVILATASVFLP